ncbi:hypothetical protein FO440_13290 [Mucilaginibacter corticis]|uniref:Uncharacterized protein n=1 Tax=Mucilaginibacter corticis TaxID=2597670 RepID=A0A556MLB2_9SPHI|nr:FUSC family membrane protein [Mucilaginibacter corticis]TSJ40714.1 hypothetical protein FO440_13290 [Mucilaginibacter corticis]
MSIQNKEVKSFFFSQYFSDGLRISLGILLPTLILQQFNQFNLGIALSLGALCISVIDAPGPVLHKRNAMGIGNLCLFIVAVTTGFARLNVFTLGLEVTVFSFLFSMFIVYGNRAASIGTSSLLIMIFMIEKDMKPNEIILYSAETLAGGLWYMLFSLVFFGIRPYRAAQQALGENIEDIVKFLRIKADFYLPDTDIGENYHKLVSQQIKVSEHQDAVRELLFKSRVMVRESTNASRILVLTFVDLVDMFEQIMATHYDYTYIHEKFKDSGVLTEIAQIVHQMANELENIGFAILSNTRYKHMVDFNPALEQLKLKIDAIGNSNETSNLVLKKILINLRDLNKEIENIFNYYNSRSSKTLLANNNDVEYSKFVTHQDYEPHVFFDNFSLDSAAFKHALRVSLVCLIGFTVAKFFALGHHSYWVLLTIIVILKPGFSLSKQRNYQRLTGTIAGGFIGVLILVFVHNNDVQFVLMLILMLGTYSFQRLNYVVSVVCMTPYVLILFKFLGVVGQRGIVEERVVDTIIGSTIAFIASYLIFPTWEFEQIKESLAQVINSNVNYLIKIAKSITGTPISTTEYKLARKDVYVKSANLSAAFERMTSEPKSKQRNIKDIHKFVVLNHILSSYTATIASEVAIKGMHKTTPDILKLVKKSIAVLNESCKKLGGERIEFTGEKAEPTEATTPTVTDNLLKEQLDFINKISNDIAKIVDGVVK